MRKLSFRHIETLQAIATAGSLIQAAAALNVTPAALTARVKSLEQAFGFRLFDRLPTGMRMTKAGEGALEAAQVVEKALKDFGDVVRAIATGEGGRLSVGAVSTAKYFAPRLIAAFVRSRPRVDLRFLIGNRDATSSRCATARSRWRSPGARRAISRWKRSRSGRIPTS